ncbi:AraC family transcriptional regulator [Paenibacillus radicis (ex Xue et al. 2023)]|uniref:AraC family transcriptional regulator n=1 Tax=Paenibacillus radicis (ex Xue et al. 2023) TaxID=2972489 RepID=A0ABT1YTQ0_9BACL|nr:AraC family transcriptional regulator [Paenibacillus radicis (ex Xue et al. 2023)]MCR8636571.1 AraC family transcriptional regulator [Paenibacillus radicis (ex Xue et al. 2023)]
MKIMNYMNLNQHPVQLSFSKDRTDEFTDIFHAHQGMELLYVHKGQGSVVVNQQIVELSPGCLVFFRPFQLHRIQLNLSPGSPYIRSLFVFEPAVLDSFLAPFVTLQSFFRQLWKGSASPQIFTGLPQESVERLLSDYRKQLSAAVPEALLEEQMLFLVALLQLLKSRGGSILPTASPIQSKSTAAELVMEWIEEHYMEEFQLDQLAKAVHLSPNHVSAVFRQSIGTNITEYLTARRIRQACWLLKTSDMTVQEIGLSIGLSNFSYFCQLFKKNVGLSPYRFKRSSQS